MSLPPERISVKRRRQEEPVETLYLEHATANEPDKKRRVTDFYFQRMSINVATLTKQNSTPPQAVWSTPPAPGVPPIRLTSLEGPKDEPAIPSVLAIGEKQNDTDKERHEMPDASVALMDSRSATTTVATGKTRRFHLARHLSSVLGPNPSGGIRKAKNAIRPPLATFIENHETLLEQAQNPLYLGKPVDKILELSNDEASEGTKPLKEKEPTLDTLNASKRHPTTTFVQARPQKLKTGTSIRDDPSTWDLESDQLADEFAALAMEFDPELQQKMDAERLATPPPPPPSKDVVMTTQGREEDYIYETYMRLPYDSSTLPTTSTQSNFGILVIGEEDEELWHKYVDSDDDSDWDEEDSNAEDNPANDYPEDEVSSDDEYGYNPYKYRNYGSDNEDFDDDKYD